MGALRDEEKRDVLDAVRAEEVEDAPEGDEGERDDFGDGEIPRGFDPDGEDGFAESEREEDGGESV